VKILHSSPNQEGIKIKVVPKADTQYVREGKKWDYWKGDQWQVFISDEAFTLSTEKQRVIGSEIFNLLKEDADSVVFDEHTSDLQSILEGFLLSSYSFSQFMTKDKKPSKLESIFVPKNVSKELLTYLENMVESVFWARDMVNLPVSHLNAEQFASNIEAFCKLDHCKTEVLNQAKIQALKMGGLLAVNQGSLDPATFTIVEYAHPKALNENPIVLVGKGVVYDTGGLSLKPTPGSMDSMKCDMAGAAMMVGALHLVAKMELPLKIICLVPATDNRPGGNAYTPGDVVTMFNASTVEVLNTDAEGRMILADALSYSDKFNPELVISSATLTGAALRAIGTNAAIVMGNAADVKLDQLVLAGEESHERLVKFPFWDEYLEPMKSSIADLKNIGGADAGIVTAGKFLETFVKAPYIHIDCAGPTFLDKPQDYKGKGGTGFGIRLMYNFLKNYPKWKATQN